MSIVAYSSQLFCYCLIGYGRPGPKGEKGEPGNFVPNSGLITAYIVSSIIHCSKGVVVF